MLEIYMKRYQNISETPEKFHYDYFKLEGGELYYTGSRKPLTTKGVLKPVGMLADILGKNRLRNLGFDIPVGPLTARKWKFGNPLCELLGLEKQLRTIRGSLKVKVAKKVELEEHITKECQKLEEFREYPGVYNDAMKEDITKRIDAMNDEVATRQESINLLKGRYKESDYEL